MAGTPSMEDVVTFVDDEGRLAYIERPPEAREEMVDELTRFLIMFHGDRTIYGAGARWRREAEAIIAVLDRGGHLAPIP